MTDYDTWSELGLIAITQVGGSDIQFGTLTETIDLDMGEKDFDTIVTVAGGRLIKFTPETETTITLELYPLEAGTDTGTTGKGVYDLLQSTDASQPVTITSTTSRTKIRLAVLWTDDPNMTDATAAPAGSHKAVRFVGADGYITSAKANFTGVLKWTITAKFPPFDKDGNANVKWESTDGTASLTALASYTSTTKW